MEGELITISASPFSPQYGGKVEEKQKRGQVYTVLWDDIRSLSELGRRNKKTDNVVRYPESSLDLWFPRIP